MRGYGMKNNRCCTFISVAIDNFGENGWCIAFKMKTTQTISNDISNNIHTSNRNPSLMETDDGIQLLQKNSQIF